MNQILLCGDTVVNLLRCHISGLCYSAGQLLLYIDSFFTKFQSLCLLRIKKINISVFAAS